MASPVFISRPPPGFSALAVLRGVQLMFVGGYRALKNPDLVKYGFYQKAFRALLISFGIQIILWLPLFVTRLILGFVGLILRTEQDSAIDSVIDTLSYLQTHVFNVGPLLISLVRYFRSDLDELFYLSLQWVDRVYKYKHPQSDREYFGPLVEFGGTMTNISSVPSQKVSTRSLLGKLVSSLADSLEKYADKPMSSSTSGSSTSATKELNADSKRARINQAIDNFGRNKGLPLFLINYLKRSALNLLLYIVSGIPIIGAIVLPLTTFNSLNPVLGTTTAAEISAIAFLVPKKYTLIFLSTFWGGRALLRQLLEPYFRQLPFSKSLKAKWFSNREGVLFGFGAGFYLLIRLPFIGVLVYGFAQASAAYLITKITDPIPRQSNKLIDWTEEQAMWTAGEEVYQRVHDDGFEGPEAGTHQKETSKASVSGVYEKGDL